MDDVDVRSARETLESTAAGRAAIAAAAGPPRAAPYTGWSRVTRTVCDAAGEPWTVFEIQANDLLGSTSPRWLLFVSSTEQRKRADFPCAWQALDDDALLALLPPR